MSDNAIVADIGRDLLMRSQQDSNDYQSKQTSVAAGGSFTFGSMTGSGYIAASQDKMKSTFDSVQEQTGLFAGDGGFDVTVGRHTQLDGAVMASTAAADKNRLDTGTLGFSDLHNEADYKVSHAGVSLSGGGSFGGDTFQGNLPGGMVSAAGSSGHAEGTTQAAIAEGTITVRDRANQQQDVADLSRDTEHANDSISPIFDKEKEQRRLAQVSAISDIGGQVADIARTQGELNALNEARKVHPDLTVEQLKKTQTYRDEQAKSGTGSTIQRGIQAATAALQGLAGGDLTAALAGASAPELAHLLKATEDTPAVNTIAHAILGGAVAALQGNSAAAGAAGAATGELAAKAIAGMLYPDVKDLSTLSEEQKQTVSVLATISAGMAGGIAGDSTGSAVAGGQAGKNAVENNSLSFGNGIDSTIAMNAVWNQYAVDNNLTPKETQAGLNRIAKGDMPDSTNITKVIVDGYQDGVMIAGAWYLGPAASVGKVVGGGILALSANGGYQYYDLNKPGNENKSWDYLGSATSFTTGMLAPGRGIWANAGIAMGGAVFTDGPDGAALTGAGAGALFGGAFGKFGPFSGEINDIFGSVGGEFISNEVKDAGKKK